MREILFRGKRFDNGEWVEGYLIHDEHCNTQIPYIGYLFGHDIDVAECILGTVGQFIGLTDKNGKKIFEGDILHCYSSYHEKYFGECVVKYGEFNCSCCDGVYGWYLYGGDIRDLWTDEFGNGTQYEVCGNIHDTAELLGGAEDGN